MTSQTAATSSVPALDLWRDVTIHTTFRAVDPIGLTEVVVEPEPDDDGVLLHTLDAAITRLITYRNAFLAAAAEDSASTPLPMPRDSWGQDGA